MNESIRIWEEKNSIDHNLNLLPKDESGNLNTITETKKKLIEKQWADTGKISGIYVIINKVNHKYYVGSSIDIDDRWYNHIWALNCDKHRNKHLQNAWNKYGENSFNFYIVEYIDINDLLVVEQKYLDYAKLQKEKVYNLSFIAGRIEMTDETREKIRNANIGRIQWNLGKTLTDAQKINMYGKTPSIETTEKRRKSMIAYWSTQDERKRLHSNMLREIRSGKKLSDDTKKKLSMACGGKNHRCYDHTLYKFYNKKLNLYRCCTRNELEVEFNLNSGNVSQLMSNKLKSTGGWILLN